MNRKDIELFGKIQTQLQDYCGKVLATLVNDYPEIDLCEYAKVIGIDVLDDYLQMTYYTYSYQPFHFHSTPIRRG